MQFEKFVLPALERVSSQIGRAIYHLDGPEEIRHLDMILSLPRVHAIQWVPVPTNRYKGVTQDFCDKISLDIYRRTLAAGKKILLAGGVAPCQVAEIFNATGGDGVFIQTQTQTRKEAEELIALARREWIKL